VERDRAKRKPYVLNGRTLVAYSEVVVFSVDGKVIFRGRGRMRLRRGAYFVKANGRVRRVLVR